MFRAGRFGRAASRVVHLAGPPHILQRAVADLRDRATYRGTNSGPDNSVVGQPAALRAWVTPVVLDSGVDAEQRLVVIGHRPVQVFHNEA